MLYIAWMVIVGDHGMKKISFEISKTSIFEVYRVKNCISRLCTGPFTHVSHYWWNQSFRIFGTGFDRP